MKTQAIYVGKHPESSSMYLVASQLSGFLGGCPIKSQIGALSGHSDVISVVPGDLPELLAARKFAGYDRLYQFFAPNFEEFTAPMLAPMIVALACNQLQGLILHSKWSVQKLKEALSEHYSPSTRVEVLKKTKLVVWGVSDEFQFSQEGRRPHRWVAPFNRLNNSQKNVALHHELTCSLKTLRAETDVLYIDSGMSSRGDHDLSAYRVVPQGSRAEYVQLIADRSAFLCTSNYESFGIYYLELMASGIFGVFLDRPWVRLLLPDYPFVYQKSQLAAACLVVMDDFDSSQKVLRDYVASTFHAFSFERVKSDLLSSLT